MTNNLPMTAFEICREYRQAKNKTAQIAILADENLCTKQEIIDILVAGGEVAGRSKGFRWTQELMNELIRLYHDGLTAPQIAERLGIEPSKVGNKIQKMKMAGQMPLGIESPIKPVENANLQIPETANLGGLQIAAQITQAMTSNGFELVKLVFKNGSYEVNVEVTACTS